MSVEAFPAVTMPEGRKAGFEPRQALEARVGPGPLVAVDGSGVGGDGDDLPGEVTVLGSRHRPPMRLEGELVALLPRDAVERGDLLDRLPHRQRGEAAVELPHAVVHEAPAERRVDDLARLGERRRRLGEHPGRPRHRLHTARHDEVGVAGGDHLGGDGDGSEAARAQAVDREARHGVGQPCKEGGHAGDIAVVLPRLVRTPEHDLVDGVGRDAGALDRLADDEGGEVVGPHAPERAAVLADGGAYDRHECRLGHVSSPSPANADVASEYAAEPACRRQGPSMRRASSGVRPSASGVLRTRRTALPTSVRGTDPGGPTDAAAHTEALREAGGQIGRQSAGGLRIAPPAPSPLASSHTTTSSGMGRVESSTIV